MIRRLSLSLLLILPLSLDLPVIGTVVRGGPSHAWAQVKAASPTPKLGGVYRRPLANNPSTLDPAVVAETYGFTVCQQIFDGLVQYDGSASISPALAQSWKASRDNLEWTFYLRKGVKFHNGREVTADDVIYSFTRILNPKLSSKAAEVFQNVKGAKEYVEGRANKVEGFHILDRYTVQIDLTEATAPFVANLAMGYVKIVPREVVEELGAQFGQRPVGTGPFKFAGWKKDEEIALAANLDYYGGRPFLDRIEYRIFPGKLDAMFAEFERGGLEDSLIPTKELDRVQHGQQYQFIRRPILRVRFLGVNTTGGPLANRSVRQALAYAVDREALAQDIYKGRYKASNGFIPPGTLGYDPDYRPYPYDPEKAKALLARAGFPGGKGLPVFQLWSSAISADIEREHEAIERYWAAVGVRVELKYNKDWPSFNGQVYEGKLPIFRYGWAADIPEPDYFLYRLFHSRSRNNITQYYNAKVDALLMGARAQQNQAKRAELFREAERRIMEDSPVIPLNYDSYERVFQPYVKSIEVSALGDPYIPMRKIWLAK